MEVNTQEFTGTTCNGCNIDRTSFCHHCFVLSDCMCLCVGVSVYIQYVFVYMNCKCCFYVFEWMTSHRATQDNMCKEVTRCFCKANMIWFLVFKKCAELPFVSLTNPCSPSKLIFCQCLPIKLHKCQEQKHLSADVI